MLLLLIDTAALEPLVVELLNRSLFLEPILEDFLNSDDIWKEEWAYNPFTEVSHSLR